MMEKNKKIIFAFLIISSIGLSLIAGFFFGKFQVVCPVCPAEDVDFSLFWEAYHKLQEKFVDKEKLDIEKMIYGAISGMVQSLNDPHTIFLTPTETKKFLEGVAGRFEGVGMEIGTRKGQLQVISPLKDSPAKKAGLRAGDLIMEIDGKPTTNITIIEAVNLIRGPKGTQVVLTIYRSGWEKPKEIEITRAVIEVPPLKWEIIEGNIVHFELYHFSDRSGYDFRKAAIEILRSPAEKIILDLRNNPGGYLEIAVEIAGWFLNRGEIVAIEDFGNKKEPKTYFAEGNAKLLPYPLIILINEGTASGAEILAGALRDNRGIKLIGEKSFGKGSIQELAGLKGGSALKITIARWLTPKKELITNRGLEPDIKVEMTDEDYEKERDPQLDKAIEVIREMR